MIKKKKKAINLKSKGGITPLFLSLFLNKMYDIRGRV